MRLAAAGYPPATGRPARSDLRRNRSSSARTAARCVARQQWAGHSCAAGRGVLTDTAQRDRALYSLLADGLVTQTADGLFALAGEE
ncbi:putative adenine glycosylase domain protein [Mycobacterium ulcerans str. Harvey]|uniref:Adenine glycosylase domain protein n=1 Tax=Mycobacterium ulcerans str. Harvey TaxID=1299332 RepID=A0ABP3AHB0_MYCUL|nr:putative adenine glycosylase domain protein [Mycobacterium ulcerans str. Harvey]